MRVKTIAFTVLSLIMLRVPAVALQAPAGSSLAVEHAVPFGTVTGKLLLLGNYLVFVDDQQPEASFVVSRGVIENLTAEGAAITVQTREPIRNRSGEVTRLSFRVAPGADPAVVTGWYGSAVASSRPGSVSSSPSAPSGTTTYQARHNHRIGDCRGRLLVSAEQVSYESVDSIGHSRRWEYKSIREIRNPNPYELEIKPFTDGTYELLLDGSGMDPAAYKVLVDRVTAARAGR